MLLFDYSGAVSDREKRNGFFAALRMTERKDVAHIVRRYSQRMAEEEKWVRAAARKCQGGRLAGQPQALLAPAKPGKGIVKFSDIGSSLLRLRFPGMLL